VEDVEVKKTKADYWAPRINAEWRKSVEGILNVGRQLIAAKEACEHGEFLRLFKGHDNAVSTPVPFSRQTGEQLMAIAMCEPIANCQHVSNLPQSWGTLYELTKLEDEQIIAGIKAGEITPDMTRADAAALRADPVEKPEREICVLAWEAVSTAYAKYADKLGEDDRLFVLERLESLVRLIKQEVSPDASRRQRGGRSEAASAAG
jgi:hypothetical protein